MLVKKFQKVTENGTVIKVYDTKREIAHEYDRSEVAVGLWFRKHVKIEGCTFREITVDIETKKVCKICHGASGDTRLEGRVCKTCGWKKRYERAKAKRKQNTIKKQKTKHATIYQYLLSGIKTCTKCKAEKPLSEFYKNNKQTKYESTCKDCRVKRTKIKKFGSIEAYEQKQRERKTKRTEKKCPKCLKLLPIESFKTKNGKRKNYCAECIRQISFVRNQKLLSNAPFACHVCGARYNSKYSVVVHFRRRHRQPTEFNDYYRLLYNGSPEPKLCKCGCHTEIEPRKWAIGIRLIHGHAIKIFGNPGRFKTAESDAKTSRHLKERYATGEIQVWNKGLTIDTNESLQKSWEKSIIFWNTPENKEKSRLQNLGRKMTETQRKENQIRQKRAWTPEKRNRQRELNLPHLQKWTKERRSLFEQNFGAYLKSRSIEFNTHFVVKHSEFDFHIANTNILVETHGDFFHARGLDFGSLKHTIQRQVRRNDLYKIRLAEKCGYKLVVVWESDAKLGYDYLDTLLKPCFMPILINNIIHVI